MIDIHLHCLPNVDDGSSCLENSIKLIKDESEMGVTDVICTCHYRLDMERFLTPIDKLKEVFLQLQRSAKEQNIPVNLHLWQEVHHDDEMQKLVKDGKVLTINDSKFMLLELDFCYAPSDLLKVIDDYKSFGKLPIIAHYERYAFATIEGARALKEKGVLIQVNAYSLFAEEGVERRDFAFKLLDEKLVDFIASDMHDYRSSNRFLSAYELVKEKYGEEYANDLFINNAREILK